MMLRPRLPEERALMQTIQRNAPKCIGCEKRLQPRYRHDAIRINKEDGSFHCWARQVVGVIYYGCNPEQLFCTFKCAYAYAVRCAEKYGRVP
jgi:hypothetical protein